MESKHLPDAIGPKPEERQVPLDRRELIKLSVGALASATFAVPLAAQENTPQHSIAAHGSMRAPGEMAPFTGSGHWFKRRPAEASLQGFYVIMPEIRAWVKPQEVASIHGDTSYSNWEKMRA